MPCASRVAFWSWRSSFLIFVQGKSKDLQPQLCTQSGCNSICLGPSTQHISSKHHQPAFLSKRTTAWEHFATAHHAVDRAHTVKTISPFNSNSQSQTSECFVAEHHTKLCVDCVVFVFVWHFLFCNMDLPSNDCFKPHHTAFFPELITFYFWSLLWCTPHFFLSLSLFISDRCCGELLQQGDQALHKACRPLFQVWNSVVQSPGQV